METETIQDELKHAPEEEEKALDEDVPPAVEEVVEEVTPEVETVLTVHGIPEDQLRSLLDILKKDHPDSLASSLKTLVESTEDQNENGPLQSMLLEVEALTIKSNGNGMHRTGSYCDANPPTHDQRGCYLHYDSSSSGKLKLQYSDSYVPGSIGFYSSPKIPAFKYKKNFGRAELIGNCLAGINGRKNYYSGWCQFIRLARATFKSELESSGKQVGEFWIYHKQEDLQGLDVDMYVYDTDALIQTVSLPVNQPIKEQLVNADAVACLPKHTDFFMEVNKVNFEKWLIEASTIGSASRFTAPPPSAMSPRNNSTSLYGSGGDDQYAYVSSGGNNAANLERSPSKTYDDTSTTDEPQPPPPDQDEFAGCYLLYNAESAKLMLQYSKTLVPNALGFYCPGEGFSIQPFKFKRNFGRAELIGNCASGVAGRKNYYSGLCQFIRAARSVKGPLWIYPRAQIQALDVDIFVYYKVPQQSRTVDSSGKQTIKLNENEKLDLSEIDAVACLPKHSDIFEDVRHLDMNRWLTEANAIGATTRFDGQ